MRAAIGLMLITTLVACARTTTEQSGSTPTPINSVDVGPTPSVEHIGRGVRCIPPGTVYALLHPLPPLSYAADDIGKPGVPALLHGERRMLTRIEHYVHSSTLRIAWIQSGGSPGRHFIVYDANRDLCALANVPYKVLNGGCNEYYGPGEFPFDTKPAPDCFGARPPWMTPTPRSPKRKNATSTRRRGQTPSRHFQGSVGCATRHPRCEVVTDVVLSNRSRCQVR